MQDFTSSRRMGISFCFDGIYVLPFHPLPFRRRRFAE